MKKMMMTLGILMSAMSTVAQEENQFTIDAQLRTRGEYNNGAGYPRSEGQSSATFINERARISMDYQRGAIELKVSAQHTGFWGQDGMNTANGRMTMNEAWAKLNIGENWYAQIGRQQLVYDDERILGSSDWNVNGNWHDALRLGYEKGANKLDMILALNQNGVRRGDYYEHVMPYKAMQGLWYHYQSPKAPLGISLLALNTGYEQGEPKHGKTKYMQTLGTDITYKPNAWDLHGAFYYQMGYNAADLKVSTCMASVKAGYQVDSKWKVSLGIDYLEGEDYVGGSTDRMGNVTLYKNYDDRTRTFNPLYGSHHLFYGFMDYFYANAFVNGFEPGLGDLQLGVDYQASKKTKMLLNYHYFTTASDCLDERELGHEIDLQFTTTLMKDVTLMGGYSVMKGSKSMDIVKGGNRGSWQDWAWISLNINPRVFFVKW